MNDGAALELVDDFDYLVSFLPPGWEAKAKELGALRRCRKVSDARTLLRVLLIHLAEGCSLRETSARVRQGGIADLILFRFQDDCKQDNIHDQPVSERTASDDSSQSLRALAV